MRAVVYRETGPSSVLELVERDLPEPGPGEVRVRLVRAGVNPTDWKFRSRRRDGVRRGHARPGRRGRGRRGRCRRRRARRSATGSGWCSPSTGAPTARPPSTPCSPVERVVPLPDGASFDLGRARSASRRSPRTGR